MEYAEGDAQPELTQEQYDELIAQEQQYLLYQQQQELLAVGGQVESHQSLQDSVQQDDNQFATTDKLEETLPGDPISILKFDDDYDANALLEIEEGTEGVCMHINSDVCVDLMYFAVPSIFV